MSSRAFCAVLLLATLFGCRHDAPEDDSPVVTKKTAKTHKRSPDDIAVFRDVALGREPYGVDPLEASDAKGTWHYRLHQRQGVVVEIERVTPANLVFWRYSYTRIDGVLLVHEHDAYDVDVGTTEVDTDGTTTHTWRSGIVGSHGCHHYKVDYDGAGVAQLLACLDGEGKPTPSDTGCEVLRVTHDDQRRVTVQTCEHADHSPATYSDGEHERRHRFDSRGRTIETAWFGVDGKPFSGPDGTAAVRWNYDDANNLIGETKVTIRGTTVSAVARSYDDHGCKVREENLDADGERTARNGVGLTIDHRDPRCGLVYEETRGAKGGLVGEPPVHAYVLDAEGLAREERCKDSLEEPISCSMARGREGAFVKYERDDRGRVIERDGFLSSGKPSNASREYPHQTRTTYGADGRVASNSYFDVDGTPAVALGMHEIHYKYDSIGAEISRTFFDVKGVRAVSLGCSEIRATYDDHHRLSGRECRDDAGALHDTSMCFSSVCWRGTARVSVVQAGAKTTNDFVTAAGKTMRTLSCETERCYR